MWPHRRIAADVPHGASAVPLLPFVGVVMARARRRPRAAGQDDPCGCQPSVDVNLNVNQEGDLEVEDPDSMEDEHLPYVWNRRGR